MSSLRREAKALAHQNETLLPTALISLLCYSMFLLATLVWVKVRVLKSRHDHCGSRAHLRIHDSLIRENPTLVGTWLLEFAVNRLSSQILLLCLFRCLLLACSPVCGVLRRAISHTATAVLIMLLIGSPLIVALSYKLGRFTTGELGKLAYAEFIASQGTPFRPVVMDSNTRTVLYSDDEMGTRPSGFDICYWKEGMVPKFDLRAHARVLAENVCGRLPAAPLHLSRDAWYLAQVLCASYSFKSSRSPSFYLILAFICLSGPDSIAWCIWKPGICRASFPWLFSARHVRTTQGSDKQQGFDPFHSVSMPAMAPHSARWI